MMTFHLANSSGTIPHAARAFYNFARLRAIAHSQRISSTLAAAEWCFILSEVILMFVYLLLLFY